MDEQWAKNNERGQTYGHARRKAVGIEDNVWHHARLREGNILCWPELTEHTLLTVATGKLVSNNGCSLEYW